jgi:crossover junction endodeoxyribonuclease RusA
LARHAPRVEPPPERALFDVCVHGQPISAQTARRDLLNAWKQQVSRASAAVWTRPPLVGDVRIRVSYYSDTSRIDEDNLKKPIQDALQGIVYMNDRQVKQGIGRLYDINAALKVRYMSEALAMAFSDGRPFIHIEVWHNPDTERVN